MGRPVEHIPRTVWTNAIRTGLPSFAFFLYPQVIFEGHGRLNYDNDVFLFLYVYLG